MIFNKSKICFIGAHPDDIELGCGALISNIADRCEIVCVTLSKNQKNPDNKNLVKEHYKSLASLKIQKEKIILADFITRHFQSSRQEICDYLLGINKKHQPDVIFAHSFSDLHQDHEIVSKEVLRIFKHKTMMGFEILPSSFHFKPNFFFEVSGKDADNKLKALAYYNTYKDKKYFDNEVLKAQLIRNGISIGKKYAEAFEVIKLASIL